MINIIKKELKTKYFVVEKAEYKDIIAIVGPMSSQKAKRIAKENNESGKFTHSSAHTGGYVETILNSKYYNYIETLETDLTPLLIK